MNEPQKCEELFTPGDHRLLICLGKRSDMTLQKVNQYRQLWGLVPISRLAIPHQTETVRAGSQLTQHISRQISQQSAFACIHRGQKLRDDTSNLCGSRGEQVAVFKCSAHGECSLSRYCQHQKVQACNRCEDRQPPADLVYRKMPAEPINRDLMTNHIIYHVMPLCGDAEPIWRKHIDWIRSVRENYNGRLILGVVTKHPNDPWGYCPPEAVQEAAKGLDAEYIIVQNDGKPDPDTRGRHLGTQGEGVTFLKMLGALESLDPNATITYGHCKGVTRWDEYHGPAPHLWAKACFDVTFRNQSEVLEALDTVPICGPFRMHGGYKAGLPGLGTHWFFSGTFFAMRAAAVFSRNWRRLRKHYGNVEQWPRFLFKMETETRCLFFDSVTNLYDAEYWQREVTPAFEKWTAEHGAV